jgi:group I intron endonuclease
MINSGIYQIRNLVNGKVYIGSTIDFSKRWIRHKKEALGKYHRNKHFQSAILKYGIETFVFEIIETVDNKNMLFIKEQFYIDSIKPYDRTIGYNSAVKAGGGKLMEDGYFSGNKNPMYGKSSKDIVFKKHGIEKWNEMNKNRSANGKDKGTKSVIQLDKNENVLKEFSSMSKASSETNTNINRIRFSCKNPNATAGGFKWKFKND